MDDTSRTSSPELSAGKWIGRVLIAVLLGEGIWGLIVSVTNNLILPLLARTMGADVQSPLYLGKGEFNVPAVFMSVLELCFAGIVAVILNSWVQRKPPAIRSKVARLSPIPAQTSATPPPAVVPVHAAASVPPPAKAPVPPPAAPLVTSSTAPSPSPSQFWSPPESSPQPTAAAPPPAPPKAPAKPAKPKAPKEVYYNIVGEPINPTEDD